MVKQTKIYSVFPGVGKTYMFNKYKELLISDLDSSLFSWKETTEGKVRNPDFPRNYINHIKSLIGTFDIVLVSTHKEVIEAMIEEDIPFTIIYPHQKLKAYYLERYAKRGSDNDFIQMMENMWDSFIYDIKTEKRVPKIELHSKDDYLSDVIEI